MITDEPSQGSAASRSAALLPAHKPASYTGEEGVFRPPTSTSVFSSFTTVLYYIAAVDSIDIIVSHGTTSGSSPVLLFLYRSDGNAWHIA